MPLTERDMFCERDILPMAKRYAPDGAWVKTPHPSDLRRPPSPQGEGKGVGQAVPLSFSGDANPFVLADISPNRGITQRGRQECRAITEGGETPPLRMVAVFTRTTNIVCVPFLSF